MSTDDNAIAQFEMSIKSYEEQLFGLSLFYDTMPKSIRWTNALSFKNMTRRGKKALASAKDLLQATRQNDSLVSSLYMFEWPPFTDDMLTRIEALLTTYHQIFPNRPWKGLSQEEANRLRNALFSRM